MKRRARVCACARVCVCVRTRGESGGEEETDRTQILCTRNLSVSIMTWRDSMWWRNSTEFWKLRSVYECVKVHTRDTQGKSWAKERRGVGPAEYQSQVSPDIWVLTRSNARRWERVASRSSASPPSACGALRRVWRSCVFILVYLSRSLWCDATAVPSRSTSIWFWGWWKRGKCVLSWVCGRCVCLVFFFSLLFFGALWLWSSFSHSLSVIQTTSWGVRSAPGPHAATAGL